MMNLPVYFLQPFVLETDTSGVGVGIVLMQDMCPIAFFSQALPPMQRIEAFYERELMDILSIVQKWQPYLLGKKFTGRTDQNSVQLLLDQRVVAGEYQRWIAK